MANDRNETICPKCNNKFSISENRTHRVKRKYAPFWFFDAMHQFENFNKVKCPSCDYQFKASEARLFLFFKSPYAVVVFCLFILIMAVAIVFTLKSG